MKKKWRESDAALEIEKKRFKAPMRSRFTGLNCGSPRTLCQQFGLSSKKMDFTVVVKGPRDRMQRLADKLFQSRVPFKILTKF